MSKEKNFSQNPDSLPNPSQQEVDALVRGLAQKEFGESFSEFLTDREYASLSEKDRKLVDELKKQGWEFVGTIKGEINLSKPQYEKLKIVGRENYFLIFKKPEEELE